MLLDALRKEVCMANRDLVRHNLVTLTWGNASGIDRDRQLVVIKPSGIPYDRLEPAQMVIVDLEGKIVDVAAQYGQVHTAGLGMALHQAMTDGRFERGRNIVFLTVGAGITVVAALYRNNF